MSTTIYKANCKKCPRLAGFLKASKQKYPDYFCKPVPAFGDSKAKFLIVGLAPGMHGANATGRPFTGDFAGILLYETLYKFGFANKAISVSVDDGLKLKNCRITNAVKCVPPANKPTTEEIKICSVYLKNELQTLKPGNVILSLGKIAHDSVIRSYDLKLSQHPFGHENVHKIGDGLTLINSYHCSRYNTQTKRLTKKQFEKVFKRVVDALKKS
ncbi:MAG: uracil-DNA glycosylase [Gammaproteobacteria bacterium]